MKKLVTIFILIIYADTVFAVAINFHHCGGNQGQTGMLREGARIGSISNSKNLLRDCGNDKLICQKTHNHRSEQLTANLSTFPFSADLVPVPNQPYPVLSLDGCDAEPLLLDLK